MYRLLYRVVLRRVPPEAAHLAAFGLHRGVARVPGAAWLLRRWLGPRDPVLRVRALGLSFPGPVGLAAGFDKDARGTRGLAALGFGFVEVGTVTAQAQPGNPKPRMFRLAADRALVNRMGFNNAGAAAAAAVLRRSRARPGGPVVGVNIGKTRAVPDADAAADYAASARAVAAVADYVVVNVSSPNTPGLRDLQAADRLRPVLAAVRSALDDSAGGRRVPLLVKIAPDLADADVDAVADLALELGLDGIVATNTTVSRTGLASPAAEVAAAGAGGLSGPPLRARSLAVLRRLRARAGDRLVLIAVGGIETPDDAWERLRAGATLVQAYTGFVYGGPLWPRRMHAGLARRIRAQARARTRDVTGAARPPIRDPEVGGEGLCPAELIFVRSRSRCPTRRSPTFGGASPRRAGPPGNWSRTGRRACSWRRSRSSPATGRANTTGAGARRG